MATQQRSTIDPQPDKAFELQRQRLHLEAGVLGRFFGTGTAASTSIAGVTVLVLLIAGVFIMFADTRLPAAEYWKIASPIITLALGYLFGRNK